jgi:hypothetical protein
MPGRWLAAAVLILVATLGCGSGSGDSISDDEARLAVNRYLATTLGLFTGTTQPQQFIDLFAPECREGVDAEALALVGLFIQGFAPELRGVIIEDVDTGELQITRDDDGIRVSPRDPVALRLKVGGAFVAASEFFAGAGFEATDDEEIAEPVLLVRRDGNVYIGDCDELRDLSGGIDSSKAP